MRVDERTAHLAAHQFPRGTSGNPGGRPRGARSRLAEITINRLLDDFEIHGVAAIEEVRKKQPATYLQCVVSLLPKQAEKIQSPLGDLSDEELAQLELWLASSRSKQIDLEANAQPEHAIDANEILRQADLAKGRTTATAAHQARKAKDAA